MRTLLCLGVTLDICPPRRPDRKPFVERFIRTQKEECVYPRQPATVAQSQSWLDDHRRFYNLERPNQAITCNNRPPSVALGTLLPLRRLPMEVDTDSWLIHYHRRSFRRKVKANGEVLVDRDHYYIGQKYRGQRVLVILDAHEKHLEFYVQSQLVKTKPIRKQLYGVLPLDEFVDTMLKEAESETRRLARKRKLTRRHT
jgi:hypothetical protein